MKNLLCLTGVLLFVVTTTYAQDCNNENAQRYSARAKMAIKDAKTDADFLNAVAEFKKALQYAPDCPDIYYNIAFCSDKSASSGLLTDIGNYSEAIKYYKKYLELKPKAPNKQEVQTRIYELEYLYDKLNELIPEMVFVEGGTFMMGCTKEQGNDCSANEKPAHRVTVGDFYIGKYEVTQAQWRAVMGTTVGQQRDKVDASWSIRGEGDNYPMYYLSWNEVQEFINRLNAATGKLYRLPTEAEWEYAARDGKVSLGYKYSGSNNIDAIAWYEGNSGSTTHAVGTKLPNELGIYDMSGNVWEWCSDWYASDYYSNSPQNNPQGPSTGSFRVLRGGSWYSGAQYCRSAYRSVNGPDDRRSNYGFRLALSL